MDNIKSEINKLEHSISQLPIGYISKKNINGKTRYYRQWNENGKIKSKYIKDSELAEVVEQITQRKELQQKLYELQKLIGVANDMKIDFITNVVTGNALIAMTSGVQKFEKRDCYYQIIDYLNSDISDCVCLVYGLRRTGKTTMLRQAISEISASESAYIKAKITDTMADMNRDLKLLYESGYKYVFIDEVTLIKDFIDSASLFSDVYAAQGMKIVLSGTDSLGFWFALHQELYDRAVTIHTTFIPFHEHSRLLKINNIDEYIRYGGTLRAGEIRFDDKDLNAADASFRNDESTRRYIDTAICRNIQNSLVCCEDGGHFRHLYNLYESGELTGAINRIIEDMNHRFLLSVLTKDFISHDLGLTARNLRNERNPTNRTDILDRVDTENITSRLMEILEIRNKTEQSVGITSTHISEIKEYLRALDLIVDCPIETTEVNSNPIEHVLFTQPGMRYCQAQALVHLLMKDAVFSELSELEKQNITNRTLEEVRGRMTEDIILLESMKALSKQLKVFKLQFAVGEFDMVIYNPNENNCRIYEIKHSDKAVKEQYCHLIDDEKCNLTERRFGQIVERCVLYTGKSFTNNDDIDYKNVSEYLKELSAERLAISEDINQNYGMQLGF